MNTGHAGSSEERKGNRKYALGNVRGEGDGAQAAQPACRGLGIKEEESGLGQAVATGLYLTTGFVSGASLTFPLSR